jgi:hypothetical protein
MLIDTLARLGSGNLDWLTVMDAIIDTFRLGTDAVQKIYHNSSGPRWFFRLTVEAFAKHYDRLLGMSRFNKTLGIICHCSQEEGKTLWIPQLASIDTDREVSTADCRQRVR